MHSDVNSYEQCKSGVHCECVIDVAVVTYMAVVISVDDLALSLLLLISLLLLMSQWLLLQLPCQQCNSGVHFVYVLFFITLL